MTLTRSVDSAGLNYMVAVTKDTTGSSGSNSNVLVLEYVSTASNNLAAPDNLLATRSGNVKAQRIDLSWTDKSTSEVKFVIERSTTSEFTSNLVTYEVGANATSYRDTTVQAKTTYYYQVFAVSSAGVRSAPSNVASVTTK